MEPLKTLLIHPSLKCNLSCKHCYSSSSPEHNVNLDESALKKFLSQAKDEGYNYLAFSGGEPLLYKPLPELLSFSKQLGYTNAITTNGMLLKSKLAMKALENIDLVNISIDGDAVLHNQIRGQQNAYEKMMEGVYFLKDNNLAFGFSHTVCHQNLEMLDFLEDLALDNRAQLLQINKLSNFGRALELTSCNESESEASFYHKLFDKYRLIYSKNFKHFYTAITITEREDCLSQLKESWQAIEEKEDTNHKMLSRYFDVLSIDEKGDVVPFGYNVSKKFTVHNILKTSSLKQSFVESKTALMRESKQLVYQSFAYLYQNTQIQFANATNLIEYVSNN